MFSYFKKEGKVSQTFTFYNLENLFNKNNDPTILDDDFTPKAQKNRVMLSHN